MTKYSCAAILVRGRDHQTQIWFSGFREEDLNVIFYQNMPNLNNRYKSTERKVSDYRLLGASGYTQNGCMNKKILQR
jgi:hypothetical protein